MKKTFFTILFFTLILSFSPVHAEQRDYKLLEAIPGVADRNEPIDFPTYITGIYKFAIGFTAIAALLMITIGGFYYVASAGNQAQAQTAKTIITDALIGLIVVFCSYMILYTINPNLLKSNIESLNNLQVPDEPTVQHSDSRVSYEIKTEQYCAHGTCYDSKAACESAGTGCRPAQKAFSQDKYYTIDGDGKYTEYASKEECEETSGDTCYAGESMKAQMFRNAYSPEEVQGKMTHDGEVYISEDAAKDMSVIATKKTIDNAEEITKKTKAHVTKVIDGSAYDVEGNLWSVGQFKYLARKNPSIKHTTEKQDGIVYGRIEIPADFPENPKLAGTTILYKHDELGGGLIGRVNPKYYDITVITAQEIAPKEQTTQEQP